MRKRFQKPRIKDKGGYWIAQYRDLDGRKRKVSLGPVAKTKKVNAELKLAQVLEPINNPATKAGEDYDFGAFVREVYLPFYHRKWKASTRYSNEQRVNSHLTSAFEKRNLRNFSRDELQDFLDAKARRGISHSIATHLRWDLRQIFRMAYVEGLIPRNPAELLFVPRDAKRYPKPRLTLEQVRLLFSVLELREQIISGLAILAGLRPGEISRCAVVPLKTATRIFSSAFTKALSTHRRRTTPNVGLGLEMESGHHKKGNRGEPDEPYHEKSV